MNDLLIQAYLAMPYRGQLGDLATDEDIADNVELAKEIAFAIQSHFPNHLSVYLPHIDPILQSWHRREDGVISDSDKILEQCLVKVGTCDMLIHCGYISGGMQLEIDRAKLMGLTVVDFPLAYQDRDFEKIAVGIWQVCKRKL